jgi:predicted extracellular nuclease
LRTSSPSSVCRLPAYGSSGGGNTGKLERYSYVFEGNSQVLDQILVSNNLLGRFGIEYDPVHVNSEFANQASDHDPQVARLDLRGRPSPK